MNDPLTGDVRLERLQWRRPDAAEPTYVGLEFGEPANNTPPTSLASGANHALSFPVRFDVDTFHEGTFDVEAVLSVDDVVFTQGLTTRALVLTPPSEDCGG